ncbi:hypothetical protein, partial [Mesorhizobium sp. WSM2561]|uniref:hypothetical protein n=1 Tax=Mesorhizobium sp. WSM2561 TaxID=1040985 RepID=UPI001AEC00FE
MFQLGTAALHPAPLFRLGAARQSTFSHKGRRKDPRSRLEPNLVEMLLQRLMLLAAVHALAER